MKQGPSVETEARIRAIERVLVSGGDSAACRAYARKEWNLSDRQTRRVVAMARERIRADWEIERPQMVADLLCQLSTLQLSARNAGQYHVALGCINSMARLCRLF